MAFRARNHVADQSAPIAPPFRHQARPYAVAVLLIGILSVAIIMIGSHLSTIGSLAIASAEWHVDNAGPGECYDIAESGDGNFVLTGVTGDAAWILKTNSTGHLAWEHTFSATNLTAKLFSLANDSTGGYVAAGYRRNMTEDLTSAWLVHVNGSGIVTWNRTYENAAARSIIACDNSGFIVAGVTITPTRLWLMRVDSNGAQLWNRTFSFTEDIHRPLLVKCANGDAALVTSLGIDGWSTEVWASRVNAATGEPLWNRTYGGGAPSDSMNEIHDAIACKEGGFLLVGVTWSLAASHSDFWLLRLGENGDILWNRAVGDGGEDWGLTVAEATTNEGFLVAGDAESSPWMPPSSATAVYRIDAAGNVLWGRSYGVDGHVRAWCALAQRNGTDFVMAGCRWEGIVETAWLQSIVDIATPPPPGFFIGGSLTTGGLGILALMGALLVQYAQRPCLLPLPNLSGDDLQLVPRAVSQLSASRSLTRMKAMRSDSGVVLSGRALSIWLHARVSYQSHGLVLRFRLRRALLEIAIVVLVVAGALWGFWLLSPFLFQSTMNPLIGFLPAVFYTVFLVGAMLVRQGILLRTFPQALANALAWVKVHDSGDYPSEIQFRGYRTLYATLSVAGLGGGASLLILSA